MTAAEYLARVEARAERATGGPWHWGPGKCIVLLEDGIIAADGEAVFVNCGRGSGEPIPEDREFMIAARTDVPRLVRMLREYSELIGMFQFWSHCDLRRADPNADYYALRSRLKTLSEYLTRVDAIANE